MWLSKQDSNQSMHFICIAFNRRKTRAKLRRARYRNASVIWRASRPNRSRRPPYRRPLSHGFNGLSSDRDAGPTCAGRAGVGAGRHRTSCRRFPGSARPPGAHLSHAAGPVAGGSRLPGSRLRRLRFLAMGIGRTGGGSPGGQFPARRCKFPARLNKFPVRRELIPCFIL